MSPSNASSAPNAQSNNTSTGTQNINLGNGKQFNAQSITFVGENEDDRCLQDLRVIDPRDNMARIERTNGGLLEGSYRWILDHPDFQKWRDDRQSRLLWIKGGAGKGKTMLMIGIINELNRFTSPDSGAGGESSAGNESAGLLSFFLCQSTDAKLNKATAVLRSLIYQLIVQQPGLISHVKPDYKRTGKPLFEDDKAFYTLSRIFQNILQDIRLTTAYLVIDGLDECETELPELLNLITRLASVPSTQVKWVLSSRNVPAIEQQLILGNAGMRICLEENTRLVSQAINTYIDYKISQLTPIKNDETWQDQIRKQLRDPADGTFLWVALVFKELRDVFLAEDVLQVVKEVPRGLQPFYDRMIDQIAKLDRNAESCHRVLSIATLAHRPVNVLELQILAGPEEMSDIDELKRIVQLCGSFLTIKQGYIYFIHQSAKDYLTKEFAKICPAGPGSIHLDIFSRSLAAMSQTLRRDIYGLERPGTLIEDATKILLNPDPLTAVHYSCIYWIDHLCDAKGQNSPHQGELQDKLAGEEQCFTFLKNHFLHWLESLSLLRKLSDGIQSIGKLRRIVQSTPGTGPQFIRFLNDAERFVRKYGLIIEISPLQTYGAALAFCPTETEVRKQYWEERLPFIKSVTGIQEGWDACLQTLMGHTDSVNAVAFSPDSTTLASASGDGTVRLWDATTGGHKKTLKGHSDSVLAVAFSPDGKTLVSASSDQTVQFWDVTTDALKKPLNGHNSVNAVAFSRDGTTIALALDDQTVQFWDVTTGAHKMTLEGHTDSVNAVAFSPDGTMLVSASDDGKVRLWDAATGANKKTLKGHRNSINAVAFSQDSTKLASASKDGTVRLWDAVTGRYKKTLRDQSNPGSALGGGMGWLLGAADSLINYVFGDYGLPIKAVAFSRDGTTLASTSDDAIWLWNTATGAHKNTLKGHSKSANAVVFSPDGTTLASASDDGTVRLWDAALSDPKQTLKGHSGLIKDVAFSTDGTTFASASEDTTVQLWDAATGAHKKTLKGHYSSVSKVVFSPDDTVLASVSDDHIILLWDVKTGGCKGTLEGHDKWIKAVVFSPDSTTLASASEDETVQLWDAATGAHKKTLKGHYGLVWDVAFSPDGRTLASGGSVDQTIRLWDVTTGAQQKTLEGHDSWIVKVAFSPDGTALASVDYLKHTVWLWDVMTGAHKKTLQGYSKPVYAVAFSPDSTMLASASDDMTVQLWDTATGAHKKTLNVDWPPSSLSFSKDAQYLKTNRGLLSLNSDLSNAWQDRSEGQAPPNGCIFVGQRWVTRDGHNLLWLPLEHRRTCTAFHDNRLVLGNASGQVTLLTFVSSCL